MAYVLFFIVGAGSGRAAEASIFKRYIWLNFSMAAFFCSIREWEYTLRVMDTLEWPNSSLMVFTSTPSSRARVAKVWRMA